MGLFRKIKNVLKKVVRAVGSAIRQISNLVSEIVQRIHGIPELIFNLLGYMPLKKMRILVLILNDENEKPVAALEVVENVINEAKIILEQEAKVRLQAAKLVGGNGLVLYTSGPSPTAALDVDCQLSGYKEDYGTAGNYFYKENPLKWGLRPFGYAKPVIIYIVRDIKDEGGCSNGPLVNYVTVDRGGLRARVIAHELGHSCGLWHINKEGNLMQSSHDGTTLTRFQKAVFRNSRHVTYL